MRRSHLLQACVPLSKPEWPVLNPGTSPGQISLRVVRDTRKDCFSSKPRHRSWPSSLQQYCQATANGLHVHKRFPWARRQDNGAVRGAGVPGSSPCARHSPLRGHTELLRAASRRSGEPPGPEVPQVSKRSSAATVPQMQVGKPPWISVADELCVSQCVLVAKRASGVPECAGHSTAVRYRPALLNRTSRTACSLRLHNGRRIWTCRNVPRNSTEMVKGLESVTYEEQVVTPLLSTAF